MPRALRPPARPVLRAAREPQARNGWRAGPARSAASASMSARTTFSPSTASIVSTVTAPGRSRTGCVPRASITVDSSPCAVAPPSRIMATSSPKSAATCTACVGLMRPERLAEGAASGRCVAANSARAIGWSGTRRASGCKAAGDKVRQIPTRLACRGPASAVRARTRRPGVEPRASARRAPRRVRCPAGVRSTG